MKNLCVASIEIVKNTGFLRNRATNVLLSSNKLKQVTAIISLFLAAY
jgi:hypothetical protein